MLVRKNGFSLVELMIVIGIISILIMAASRLWQTSDISQQKTIQFAEFLQDIIRNARQDMVIGKWIIHDDPSGNISHTPTVEKRITVSTGSIELAYKWPNQSDFTVEQEWQNPFLENDARYTIAHICTANQLYDPNCTHISSQQIIFGKNGTTTIQDRSDKMLFIQVEHGPFSRCVVVNATVGTTEIVTACLSEPEDPND